MLPNRRTTESSTVYLSTQSELAAFCECAASHKVLAVDTEFLREKTYYPSSASCRLPPRRR